MKIEGFEMPEAEVKMLSEWNDMMAGRKTFDAEKARSIESWITAFLSVKVPVSKSQ